MDDKSDFDKNKYLIVKVYHPLTSHGNQSLARKTVKVNTSCLDCSVAIVGSTKGEDIYDKFSKSRLIEKG